MSTQEPTPVFTLKNGSTESKSLVALVVMAINRLMDDGEQFAVFELVTLCRNPNHRPNEKAANTLKEVNLVSKSNGQWWADLSIRNIVLSCATGEGMDMKIRNPVERHPTNAG